MLEKRTKHATVEVGAAASLAEDRARRPACDLRVADDVQTRRSGEQGTSLTQAGEELASINGAHQRDPALIDVEQRRRSLPRDPRVSTGGECGQKGITD